MSTYTVRKVMRPKKGNPFVMHEGVQILLASGMEAVFRHSGDAGQVIEIREPVIDFNSDGRVLIQSLDAFGDGKKVTHEPLQVVAEGWFDNQYHSVLADIRPYSLFERDCTTNADTLIYGAPKYQQLKIAAGVVCFVLLVAAVIKK